MGSIAYPVLFPEEVTGPSASTGGGGGAVLPEGRYVRIERPTGIYLEEGILNLGELEVFDESDINVALNASVIGGPGVAHTAGPFENLTDVNYSNFAHTTGDGVPFLRVDLGGVHKIKKIVITNRPDCCKERVVDAKVIILGANGSTVVKETPSITTTADKYTLTFPENTWS